MTSIDGVLTPEAEPSLEPAADPVVDLPAESPSDVAIAPRRRLWPRLLIGFVIGFVLALGLVGVALLAFDNSYEGKVLAGVHVGGVDLSGMDRDGAAAALETAFAGYADGRVVVRTSAGDVTVPYRDFSRRANVASMVEAAMQTGRAGTPLERAAIEVRLAVEGLSLEPSLVLDPNALAAGIQTAVSTLDKAPVDSRVIQSLGRIYTMPSRPGRLFDGTVAAAAALEVVQRTDAPAEVVVEATATIVPPFHGDSEALAVKASAERMIGDVVVKHGKKHWKIKASTIRKWLRIEVGADGVARPTIDQTAIAGSLKKVAKAVKLAPISAKYLKSRNGKVVGVAPSSDGRRLDRPATAAAIAQALIDRGSAPPPTTAPIPTTAPGSTTAPPPTTAPAPTQTTVKVRVIKVEPKLTTSMASVKGPVMARLGSWKTWFPINDHNFFGANIWQPARIIDGTVLRPGQRFEWWSAVGPVNSARGFGPGGFIAGNHTEPTGALGGGMCSSSTTLFNAALRAGLRMGARSNHKYYIYRYPLGLDATVSKTRGGGSQTMSFTNDMKTPIVIRTFRYRAGGKGWVRYEIWGIPDGRKVSLSKPSVANVRKAVTRTVLVSSLRKGVREQTEYPANGMDVSVTRVVRNRHGKVIHRDVYRTHYVLWNGVIEVGR